MCRQVLMFVAAASLSAVASTTARAAYTAKGTINVPAGWRTFWTVDFTKDGEVIGSSTKSFTNGTSADVTKEWEENGPDDANDFETHSRTRKIPTNIGATASAVIPTQVPVTAGFLAASGFIGANSFDLPLVVGDVNHNGLLDETDAPVYSRVDNLFAFAPLAHVSNFPMNSLLSTDAGGHAASLAGITFYADESMTQPFGSGSMLVTGIVSQSVPEPSTALGAAAIGLGLLRRRRKR